MSFILQQLITGLSIGGIYALIAVGYALIYSVFDFSNFSFGCVMMVSGFVCYYSMQILNVSLAMAIALSIAASIVVSLLTELVAYRPLRKMGTDRLFLMITGMGIDLAVANTATILLGANARKIDVSELNLEGSVALGSVFLTKLDVFALILAFIILAALYVFIYRTKSGLGIRGSAYDVSIAGLMGVNVNRVSFIIFFISGITAGFAGILCGMKYAVIPTLGSTPALKAFIASVVGGLGSLPGAVVGGLILGVLETLTSGFVSSVYRDLISYGVLIIAMMFLPHGLLGRSHTDKL
ncbi:MAG TPA: branched-chain amino acid ABC transporter permease [Clostridia bacterium]|nr:branched-chain amino acid ABC transporter permease [Clostridia bacterium]HOS17973.1 branched-chain amino acid ABC transporter permease [Clostridia bacterium]HPK15028.1 branched-chain amino acid ABC transporter permease [Clostridia bacterium]